MNDRSRRVTPGCCDGSEAAGRREERETAGRCPECRGDLPRSRRTRHALLEYGCVYCGADLADHGLAAR